MALALFLCLSSFWVFYSIPYASCTVTWSYNAGTNTATASGSGSTNFAALVAADSAGGWGKFTADATGTQIIGLANLIIGDGTNAVVFSDSGKMYLHGSSTTLLTFAVLTNSSLTLSKCFLNLYFSTGYTNVFGNITLTNCYVLSNGNPGWNVQTGSNKLTVTDSTLDNMRYVLRNSPVFNRVNNVGVASWYIFTTNGTFNDLKVSGAVYLDSPYTAVIKNSQFMGSSIVYSWLGSAGTATLYFINVIAANWHFTSGGTVGTWKHYRQYEFDLSVLNGEITEFVEDANVTLIKGSYRGTWLTNSSGQIDTQTLTYGYYNQPNGDNIQDATTPFTLTVTHPDWATYTSRFYITEKTKMTISMQEPTAPEVWGETEESVNYIVIFLILGTIFGFMISIFIVKRRLQ